MLKFSWVDPVDAVDPLSRNTPSISRTEGDLPDLRSEEHTSELQSQSNLVCRLLLEKKKHSLHALLHPSHELDPHRTVQGFDVSGFHLQTHVADRPQRLVPVATCRRRMKHSQSTCHL